MIDLTTVLRFVVVKVEVLHVRHSLGRGSSGGRSSCYGSWKVIQRVVLKVYSASAAVIVCSNVSRGLL